MVTKVEKWGNGLGVRIPKSFAAEAKLVNGSAVNLSVREGCLVVTPIAKTRFALDELLAGVTRTKVHAQEWADDAVGREAQL
ncbi:MAG TPA: AbrB/MazE/SpoVT family DNA-binding domain-containing protein [Planctomycetota bacterium]|nr:AbrB/MazE/SpoVT family DNA-binding domain-containing protein [Planctomycetota bacterium]